MNRYSRLISLLLVLTLCLGFAASASAVELKIAATVSEEDPQTIALNNFSKAMAERTNGEVSFVVYPNSMLGSEMDQWEMARVGTVAMSIGNVSSMSVYIPTVGVLALPYLFHSKDDCIDYISNAEWSKDFWDELCELTNLRFVAVQVSGSRCLSTNESLIVNSPADLDGVKIRSMEPQVWQDVIRALGGTPIPVAFNELYVALQTGVVSGQDNPLGLFYSQKFYEVQKNFYKTEHSYNTTLIAMNNDVWESFTDEQKEIFNECVQEFLYDDYNVLQDAYNAESETFLRENGVKIWEQNELDMAAFWANADKIIQENYMSDEAYAEVINDVKARFNY